MSNTPRIIALPPQINSAGLLPFLGDLGQPVDGRDVILDFARLRRVTPAGLTALASTVLHWRSQQVPVSFEGLRDCAITSYLSRMDALQACGETLTENFVRQDAGGRFVPVRRVDHRVEDLGYDIATCLAPGGEEYEHPMSGLHEFSWYVLTEVANNIRQHSAGTGFASAQANRGEGMVRIALSDNGVGILRSFQRVEYPGSAVMSDGDAILHALKPRVSCKCGPPNEGVGLTLVSQLAHLTEAWLMIVSGTGVLLITAGKSPRLTILPAGGYFQGTLMTMAFPERSARNFSELLHEAKNNAGLLRPKRASSRFQP